MLYDVIKSKNPKYPYWNYEKFTLQDKSEAECKTDYTTFLFIKQEYPIHLFSSRGNRITATVKLPVHELNQNMAIRRPENICYRDFKGKIAALENILFGSLYEFDLKLQLHFSYISRFPT